jgi:hypothetical protein
VPAARPLWARVAGRGRNPYQDGQQGFTHNSLQDFIRAADERLAAYLRRLDEGDVEEGGTGGGVRTKDLAEKIVALCETRGRYSAMQADLQRTGESQISLTGPDSRAMAAHTKVGVDAKHKMIVEQAMGGSNSHMVHMFR